MSSPDPRRASDRWVTPGVVIAALFLVALLVLATIAAVTLLQLRGYDPEPMLKLAGMAVAAGSSVAGLFLQLIRRSTDTKLERNTNIAANNSADAADLLEGLHRALAATTLADTSALPYVPPVPARATAPAGPGS